MDDNSFDDIIKNKVDNFEDLEFDPSALASFHYKMDASVQPSFYDRYKNEILVAAATAAIAILILFGTNRSDNGSELLNYEIEALRAQNAKLDDLGKMLQDAQNSKSVAPDTIRIIEYRNNMEADYSLLLDEIAQLKLKINAFGQQGNTKDYNVRKELVYIGRQGDLSEDIVRELNRDNKLVRNGQYIFLEVDDDFVADSNPYLIKRKGLVDDYYLPEYRFVWDSTMVEEENLITNVENVPIQISLKKMKELEKHYQKGVGIELGPSFSVQRGFGNNNTSSNVLGGGIAVDFITSPTLSIETGLSFNNTHYSIQQEDLTNFNLPDSNPNYGDVELAEITSWFFELPAILKYRQRVSQRNHLIYGAGVSAFFYTKQKIELRNTYDAGNDFFIPVESSIRIKQPEAYFGTLNLSLGISSELKNGKRIETSLVHKNSIGKLGYEETDSNFIGIMSSYLFNVR